MRRTALKGLIELGWFDDDTLLAGLCAANGQQGGTIHQFLGNQDWSDMVKAYRDYRKCGIEFPSKAAFDKLAKQYQLTINWKG